MVPARPARARPARAGATSTCGATTPTAVRRRPHHLLRTSRRSNWTWDPVAGAVLLAPLLLPPARPQLRQPRGRGGGARRARPLARHGRRRAAPRRRAVPVRARGHELREPARDARVPQAAAHAHRRPLRRPHAARRGQPVAGGRRRLLRRRRRVPHELPLPADAAAVHGAAAWRTASRSSTSSSRRPSRQRAPVGDVPAQPRRADPRDGHRRGARLHVPGLRHRRRRCASTSASAAGWRRCSATTGARSSCSTRCCSRCPARRSSTTATRSAWATTSTSATATACARRCSGRPTATPASRRANPQRLYLPLITEQEYHYESVNVETQTANPSSLLSWMRQLIALRKRHPVLGRGDDRVPRPRQPPRARLRPQLDGEQPFLCVANLSRLAQHVELDLPTLRRRHAGRGVRRTTASASSATGRTTLTLAPYGFFWFALDAGEPTPDDAGDVAPHAWPARGRDALRRRADARSRAGRGGCRAGAGSSAREPCCGTPSSRT